MFDLSLIRSMPTVIVFYKIKVAHLGKKLLTKSSPPIE